MRRFFKQTTTRTVEGRFQVRLPFKSELNNMGDGFRIAQKRLDSLERKFRKDKNIYLKYSDFMNEYLRLGHMSYLSDLTNDCTVQGTTAEYFLPHHAVFKVTENENKIRVVFDASAKSETGQSLNDSLMTGPKVQNDIFDIILRFRTYKYAFAADITKMYRQILIHPQDRAYHKIIWRDPDDGKRKNISVKYRDVWYDLCAIFGNPLFTRIS